MNNLNHSKVMKLASSVVNLLTKYTPEEVDAALSLIELFIVKNRKGGDIACNTEEK